VTAEDFQADVRQERHEEERREQSMSDLVDQLEAELVPLRREHEEVKAARNLIPGDKDFKVAWERVVDLHDIAELAQ
jgi:hypothetical protein